MLKTKLRTLKFRADEDMQDFLRLAQDRQGFIFLKISLRKGNRTGQCLLETTGKEIQGSL